MDLSRINTISVADIPRLGKKDLDMIAILVSNGRVPLKELAKSLRISPEGCSYRLKRLQEKGVIKGFCPLLNTALLGFTAYHVFLLLEESHHQRQDKILEKLKSNPAVKSIIEYVDRWDYEIVFLARSVEEFDSMLMECLAPIHDLIIERDVLEEIKPYYDLPVPHTGPIPLAKPRQEPVILDEPDKQLIRLLVGHGRDSSYELSARLKKSPDATLRRLNALQGSKVIRHIVPVCDLSLLGLSVHSLVITTKTYDHTIDASIRSFVESEKSIIYAARTLGTHDFIFYIAAPDLPQFYTSLRKIKSQFANIIKTYDSWCVVCEHYFNPVPEKIL